MGFSHLLKNMWMLALLLLSIGTLSKGAYPVISPGMTPEQQTFLDQAIADALALAKATAVTFEKCDGVFHFGPPLVSKAYPISSITSGTFLSAMMHTITWWKISFAPWQT